MNEDTRAEAIRAAKAITLGLILGWLLAKFPREKS